MPEILERRTRNSKTFHLGGRKYSWDGVIGAIHYKDNPKDEAEQWKDIDTTIVDGRVRKAPYDLDVYLDGMPGFHYKSKESGEFDIRLRCARSAVKVEGKYDIEPVIPKPRIEGNKVIWENIYPDTDVVLIAGNTRVSLKRILKSAKAPLEYDVDIQEVGGVAKLKPLRPALDANGQQLVMEEKAIAGGRIEKLKLEPAELEGVQPITFPIEDSTEVDEDVGAGADDGYYQSNWFDSTSVYLYLGQRYGSLRHGFARWTGVTISGTIDVSYMQFYHWISGGSPLMKVYGVDEDNPDAPETYGEAQADPLTSGETAVDWDEAFSGTWDQSPSLNGIFQELVNSYTIENDAVMLQVKDDGSADGSYNCPYTYDNDPSDAPKLHIEYTAGAAGWSHKFLGVANAAIGKICGVAIADIKKVNGVE